MRSAHVVAVVFCLLVAPSVLTAGDRTTAKKGAKAPEAKSKSDAEGTLDMSPAVACLGINGYEDYEPLPGAALTADEKLLVYYRVDGYRVERSRGSYHIHLAQDGQIRRRGEKAVLLRKQNMVDYEVKEKGSPHSTFMRNTFSLKGLKPGDYDYDIILHDKLAKVPPTIQTLKFRVIPAALPKSEEDAKDADDRPSTAPRKKEG